MTEEPERRMYELGYNHNWAYLENVRPPHVEIPNALLPAFVTRYAVEDLDELSIYQYGDEPPHFPEEGGVVEATPEELSQWQDAYERYEEAAQQYHKRAEMAAVAYELIMRQAETELTAAMAQYRPVEEELKARSLTTAAKVHAHKEAARAFLERKQAAEEAVLDAKFGPRILALYPPNDLDSYRKGDRIARVHLTDCKRRRGRGDTVRAHDAVEWLSDPAKWPKSEYTTHGGRFQMRVKLCSFCKPWRVMIEHAGITAETFRQNIKLEERPDGLTDDLRKAE